MKVTFCRTKAGGGFKIAVGDKWLYTSEEYLLKVILGEARSCRFSAIEDEPESSSYSAFDEEDEDCPLDIYD